MSNYIVVQNGLLKKEKPNTLPIVEFKSGDRRYTYMGILPNPNKTPEKIPMIYGTGGEVPGVSEGVFQIQMDQLQRGDMIPYNPSHNITREHIEEAFNYVFNNNPRRYGSTVGDNPLSGITLVGNPILETEEGFTYTLALGPEEVDSVTRELTPLEAYNTGVITDIEYLDLISNTDV